MTGVADARIEQEIRARLAEGPAAADDLVAAACASARHAIGGREGAFHALLHRLVRAGDVVVVGRDPSGGAVYALAGAERVADLEAAAPVPPPVSRRDSRIALAVASKVRDPEDRGRVVADVLAHRAALSAAGRLSDFGSAKAAREMLRRVDRGRFALVVPDGPWERIVRFVRHEGPAMLGTLAVLALLYFVAAEFRVVPTSSMQPGIKPGDRLLVWKWGAGSVPERWQVIVFRRRDDGTVLIKRVVGLPGERIAIDDGDLLVDGAVAAKPDDVRDAMREPLVPRTAFDDRGLADGWSVAPDGWRTWTRALFADEPAYTDEDGRPEANVPPRPLAHDVYLTIEASRGCAARLRFVDDRGRAAEADCGEVVFTRGADGALTLTRSPATPAATPEVLARGSDGGPGVERATLSVVDGAVRLESATLRFSALLPQRRLHGATRAEVALRGAVRAATIDRDVHYTQPHEAQYAIDPATPHRVSDGAVFVLGDHSAHSRDSRFSSVGDVSIDKVVGRAIFRVWPFPRAGRVR